MFVCIAGHTFEIQGSRELGKLLPNFCPFEVSEGVPLFTIKLYALFELPQEKPSIEFDYELANGEQVKMQIFLSETKRTFSIKAEGQEYNMLCRIDDGKWLFETDAQLKNATRYIIDHFVVQAFSLATLPYKTLLIHASTINYAAQAVLFLAESGTGKSTHTRLWMENIESAKLLNDDAPAVRVVDGKPVAFGTPWSGKMQCWKNESYPVRAFVRIRRAQFNKMTLLSHLQAITALVPSCLPTLQRTETDLDNILQTLSDIIATTESYTLDCLPNAEAAITARNTLFKI